MCPVASSKIGSGYLHKGKNYKTYWHVATPIRLTFQSVNQYTYYIYIQNNEWWNGQNSHTGRVPSTTAVFPRWIATAALYIKKWKERGSPDSNLVRWLSSLKNVMASEPNTPDVSMAKWWLVVREEYFCFFLHSASSATAPASLVASVMWDGANVSGRVASHTRTRPPFHGTIVKCQ